MSEKLSADLNIIQSAPIELELLGGDLNIIQKLDDEPNDVGGLTSAELKAKFDESGNIIKKYINETLIPAVLAEDATEESRKQAEAARVAAEQVRQSNEAARQNAEAQRVSAENARNVWEDYSSSKAYAVGNKVASAGSSYLCIKPCTGIAPPNAEYWRLIAAKGAKGDTGAQGAQGPQGPQGAIGPEGPVGGSSNFVRYDAAQTLTDAQKTQARENIEAQNGALVTGSFSTKGWYRIVTGTAYSGGILTVQHSYNNGGPSSLKLLVTLSEDGSSLKCIEYTNYTVSAITNARIVLNASGYCIDVYYNINGSNTSGIDFISTGLARAGCQAPVYIGADDTLPSNEILKATMEYLNPPLVLGVEYRTTERYLGKPVYAKLVNFGALPNATRKFVKHNIPNVSSVISVYGSAQDQAIGVGAFGAQVTGINADNTNVAIWTSADLSNYSAYVAMKYTKTTD